MRILKPNVAPLTKTSLYNRLKSILKMILTMIQLSLSTKGLKPGLTSRFLQAKCQLPAVPPKMWVAA